MGSVGLPLTIGFVGEFLALMGFFKVSIVLTALAGTGIILGAIYMLTLYKRSFFGVVTNEANRGLSDLNARELTALVPLVALVIFLGIYPKPILAPVDASVKKMLILMDQKAERPETSRVLREVNTIGEVR